MVRDVSVSACVNILMSSISLSDVPSVIETRSEPKLMYGASVRG